MKMHNSCTEIDYERRPAKASAGKDNQKTVQHESAWNDETANRRIVNPREELRYLKRIKRKKKIKVSLHGAVCRSKGSSQATAFKSG